jgi:hypothetical protein
MQVKADAAVHTADQFDARGLVVVTASDSTQYAFDGDELRGTATPSRFTSVLVDGLASGEADVDRDGFVTVDDAFDFVRRRLADDGVPQSPRTWEFDVAGHIVLGRTESAPASLVAPLQLRPPPLAAASAAHPPSLGWWLSAVSVVAACVAATWAVESWLLEFADNWLNTDALPANYSLPAILALAAVWGAATSSPPSSPGGPATGGTRGGRSRPSTATSRARGASAPSAAGSSRRRPSTSSSSCQRRCSPPGSATRGREARRRGTTRTSSPSPRSRSPAWSAT